MGEKIEHIVYSLLPLILIILVSWFFSFLGSRVKKQAEEAPQPRKTESAGNEPLVFLDEDDVVESPRPAQRTTGFPMPAEGSVAPAVPASFTGPPQVTPKPIEPKWWGA